MSPLDLFNLRDPFSAWSHFVAFLASIAMIRLFWRLSRGDHYRRVTLMCFGVSLALLFGASATYHALNLSQAHRRIFQMIDHSAIYFLIAGTYTPTLYLLLRHGAVRTAALVLIWAMAIAGIVCKWLFTEQPYWLVVTPYIALGWVGTLIYHRLHRAVGFDGMKWVVLGGLSYSIGAVFDWQEWPSLFPPVFGSHELFHVLAITGALCHIVFMVKYAVRFEHTEPLPVS